MSGTDFLGEQVVNAVNLHLGVKAGGDFDGEEPVMVTADGLREAVLGIDHLELGAEGGHNPGNACIIIGDKGGAENIINGGDIRRRSDAIDAVILGIQDRLLHTTISL